MHIPMPTIPDFVPSFVKENPVTSVAKTAFNKAKAALVFIARNATAALKFAFKRAMIVLNAIAKKVESSKTLQTGLQAVAVVAVIAAYIFVSIWTWNHWGFAMIVY